MTDNYYWLYLLMYVLQISCIVFYSVYLIKAAIKYMLYSFANGTYKQWKISLTIGSAALVLGIIGVLYYTRVRADNSLVMQMWIPICIFYWQIKTIVFHWTETMKKGL